MEKKFKIYTKTGDKGETSLIGGRVKKDDARIEAIGSVDEANSTIGIAISSLVRENGSRFESLEKMKNRLLEIQHFLFDCGADLANATNKPSFKIHDSHVTKLENWIDEYESILPPLKNFILPGGSECSSFLHSARTIVRRAERRVTTLNHPNPSIQQFLNRLSDFLFVTARIYNFILNIDDIPYHSNKRD